MTKNLKVDDELHKELKERAAKEGQQLRDLVESLLREALLTTKGMKE